MNLGDVLMLIGIVGGFISQSIVLLAGLSFAWGQVRTQISTLSESIDRLADSVVALDGKVGQHGERLARLEAERS